jgi:hypothetical protein
MFSYLLELGCPLFQALTFEHVIQVLIMNPGDKVESPSMFFDILFKSSIFKRWIFE